MHSFKINMFLKKFEPTVLAEFEHFHWVPFLVALHSAGVAALSYTIYLEIVLSAAECPQKHGGCDVTGVNLGYDVHAVIH